MPRHLFRAGRATPEPRSAQKHRPDGGPVSSGGESLPPPAGRVERGPGQSPTKPAVLTNPRHGRRGHGLAGGRQASYVSQAGERAATPQTTQIPPSEKSWTLYGSRGSAAT